MEAGKLVCRNTVVAWMEGRDGGEGCDLILIWEVGIARIWLLIRC